MTTTNETEKVLARPQAVLKRNPSMTKEQFSTHWYGNHAPKVIPYFLSAGVEYYAQIHNIVPASGTSAVSDLDISEWDGAAELQFADVRPEGTEAGKKYFEEVILVDERRFLVSEALKHVQRVEAGTVIGERRVIIEDGKVVCGLDYGKDAELWRSYVSGNVHGSSK